MGNDRTFYQQYMDGEIHALTPGEPDPNEERLKHLDQANQLRSWADTFGFELSMGRDEDCPYILVDGETFIGGDVGWLLQTAAKAMGMSEERLNNDPPKVIAP